MSISVFANSNFHLQALKHHKLEKVGIEEFITIKSKDLDIIQSVMGKRHFDSIDKRGDFSLVKVDQSLVQKFSWYFHQQYKKCGGFWWEKDKQQGLSMLGQQSLFKEHANYIEDYDHSLADSEFISKAMNQVQEINIRSMIKKLSSFKNRFYKSKTGVQASEYIKDQWSKILAKRSDGNVKLFKHKRWPQPSVIAEIKGTQDGKIIIGGHLDSINILTSNWVPSRSTAPGADDNASGIATITETMRVLVDKSYKPKYDLVFIGYAAEEVGLKGSDEIARTFQAQKVPVLGVMQLDMTNYSKGNDPHISLVGDFTNAEQNKFLGELIDRYVKVPWNYMQCGYACSDHASWSRLGYRASFPNEAKNKSYMNGRIHTTKDTLKLSGGHAKRSTHFSKLALAYMVTLDAQQSF